MLKYAGWSRNVTTAHRVSGEIADVAQVPAESAFQE
jgi:hypothetical protein